MWTDRDTTEESVYDFNKRLDNNGPYATITHNGGTMDHLDPTLPHGAQDPGRGGGEQPLLEDPGSGSNGFSESLGATSTPDYHDPPPPPSSSSTATPPTTTLHGAPLPSLDYHSAPTMDLRLEHNHLAHNPLDASHQLHYDHSMLPPHDLMGYTGGGSPGDLGGHETSMMMMLPPTPLLEENHRTMTANRSLNHHGGGGHIVGVRGDDVKLPTAKERPNYLKKYAHKFGLNDRGCYIACFLAALAFLFLLIIIAMGSAWPTSSLRHTGPLHFCSTPPCLEAAAGIMGKQNASYEPCADFWRYACDGWNSRQSLPSSKSSWSTLDAMEHAVRIEKSRFITMASHEPSQFNSIEWKVQNFYQSCMSLSFIESDREKPLTKVINSLGGWDVLRSFNLYSWDSHRVLRQLHTEHYVDAFFGIRVAVDVRDPALNIITIRPDGLGMPDKSYYHRLPDDPAVQAYQTFMKDSAQLFGASSTEAHKFSIDMFNFEKRISEITPDGEYLDNPTKVNNRMSVKDLHTMAINIPWLEILKSAYPDAPMSEETKVVVVSPQYAADIAVIMATTDRASLNNYLMWRLVQAYMPYLSKPFREVADLYRKSIAGAQKPLERWEFCEVTTERFFDHLLNSMFAQQHDSAKNSRGAREPLVTKIFDYIKHNVAKSVSVSASYDYASRRAAMAKLKNMTIQVGSPGFLLDRKYLKVMYNPLLVQKTDFFQNIQYGVMFLRKREELALVSPSEESRWLDLLNKDRASYSEAANKVIVPEFLLLEPLFHPGFPNSVNLGGLGVKISEAVIRGVVGYGLLFDTRGLLQWAGPGPDSGMMAGSGLSSNISDSIYAQPLSAFQSSSRCLARRFAGMGLDSPEFLDKSRFNSAVTVSALSQTFATLEDILEMEKGVILPAMETYDPQSVFLLTYAQSLCGERTAKQKDLDRTAGDELVNEELMKAVFSQSSEHFEKFYGCGSSSDEEICPGVI